MWSLQEGGHAATKMEDGKVLVRIIRDARGIRYHRYDMNFKMIEMGTLSSVKEGMEKFNDA